ncbi:unnamed protein product, partial [Prorocentrum cordatum]
RCAEQACRQLRRLGGPAAAGAAGAARAALVQAAAELQVLRWLSGGDGPWAAAAAAGLTGEQRVEPPEGLARELREWSLLAVQSHAMEALSAVFAEEAVGTRLAFVLSPATLPRYHSSWKAEGAVLAPEALLVKSGFSCAWALNLCTSIAANTSIENHAAHQSLLDSLATAYTGTQGQPAPPREWAALCRFLAAQLHGLRACGLEARGGAQAEGLLREVGRVLSEGQRGEPLRRAGEGLEQLKAAVEELTARGDSGCYEFSGDWPMGLVPLARSFLAPALDLLARRCGPRGPAEGDELSLQGAAWALAAMWRLQSGGGAFTPGGADACEVAAQARAGLREWEDAARRELAMRAQEELAINVRWGAAEGAAADLACERRCLREEAEGLGAFCRLRPPLAEAAVPEHLRSQPAVAAACMGDGGAPPSYGELCQESGVVLDDHRPPRADLEAAGAPGRGEHASDDAVLMSELANLKRSSLAFLERLRARFPLHSDLVDPVALSVRLLVHGLHLMHHRLWSPAPGAEGLGCLDGVLQAPALAAARPQEALGGGAGEGAAHPEAAIWWMRWLAVQRQQAPGVLLAPGLAGTLEVLRALGQRHRDEEDRRAQEELAKERRPSGWPRRRRARARARARRPRLARSSSLAPSGQRWPSCWASRASTAPETPATTAWTPRRRAGTPSTTSSPGGPGTARRGTPARGPSRRPRGTWGRIGTRSGTSATSACRPSAPARGRRGRRPRSAGRSCARRRWTPRWTGAARAPQRGMARRGFAGPQGADAAQRRRRAHPAVRDAAGAPCLPAAPAGEAAAGGGHERPQALRARGGQAQGAQGGGLRLLRPKQPRHLAAAGHPPGGAARTCARAARGVRGPPVAAGDRGPRGEDAAAAGAPDHPHVHRDDAGGTPGPRRRVGGGRVPRRLVGSAAAAAGGPGRPAAGEAADRVAGVAPDPREALGAPGRQVVAPPGGADEVRGQPPRAGRRAAEVPAHLPSGAVPAAPPHAAGRRTVARGRGGLWLLGGQETAFTIMTRHASKWLAVVDKALSKNRESVEKEAVAVAVRALQQVHGFNVILSAAASSEERLLLHAKPSCRSGDRSQVARLSEEYRCAFLSNVLFLSQEGPWLSSRLRSWLKETKGQLQIQYAFAGEGQVFLPRFSGLVLRHIGDTLPRQCREADCSSAGEPAVGPHEGVPDGPADGEREAWEVKTNKGWRELDPEALAALEAARAAGGAVARFRARGFGYELDLAARVQRNVETGRCREVRPRQWEPPAPAPSRPRAPHQACVVAVRRGALSELLLCVACVDEKAALLCKAGLLFGEVLCTGGKSLQEDDGGDDELACAISARGEPWNFGRRFMTYTVRAGRHAGLRAVGVGSSRAKRRRAAHLALAATAALHALPVGGGGPPHLRAELQGLARVAEAAERARTDLWRRCSR